ncbi:flagellar protein FlaG [Undibacterium sp. Di26W]|uniref:flagellar protein FlaG n=1 Tax=Undibacterium sp. Di26W TaxID=3413035 RepID=UPI003BF0AA5B
MNISQITGGGTSISAVEPRQNVKSAPKLAPAGQDLSTGTVVPAQDATPDTAISNAELKQSVDKINRFIDSSNSVNLNLDSGSGKVVVQIVDRETNTVIQQIPSAQALSIAKDLGGKTGLLLDAQA